MNLHLIEYITGGADFFPFVGIVLGIILLVNGNKQDNAKKVLAAYFFIYSIGVSLANIYYYYNDTLASQLLDPITILIHSITLPILMLYSFEIFSTGWATPSNGIKLYMPVIIFTLSYIIIWFIKGDNPQFNSWEELAANINNPLVWMRFISIMIAFFYGGGLIMLMHFKADTHNSNLERNYSYVDGLEVGWLRWVSYLFSALCILFALLILLPGTVVNHVYAFFSWVIWIILFVKGMKQGNAELNENSGITSSILNIQDKREKESVDSSDDIDSDRRIELKNKILDLLNDEAVYLNPDLSLQHLALIAGSNRSYVSKIINEEFKVNFFDLINQKRVEYAKKQLLDSKNDNYSLNFISQLCGFKCDRTMYRAFIKFVGESPSKYRSNNQGLK